MTSEYVEPSIHLNVKTSIRQNGPQTPCAPVSKKVSSETVDIPKIVGYVQLMPQRSTRMNSPNQGLETLSDRVRSALLLLVLVLISIGGVG